MRKLGMLIHIIMISVCGYFFVPLYSMKKCEHPVEKKIKQIVPLQDLCVETIINNQNILERLYGDNKIAEDLIMTIKRRIFDGYNFFVHERPSVSQVYSLNRRRSDGVVACIDISEELKLSGPKEQVIRVSCREFEWGTWGDLFSIRKLSNYSRNEIEDVIYIGSYDKDAQEWVLKRLMVNGERVRDIVWTMIGMVAKTVSGNLYVTHKEHSLDVWHKVGKYLPDGEAYYPWSVDYSGKHIAKILEKEEKMYLAYEKDDGTWGVEIQHTDLAMITWNHLQPGNFVGIVKRMDNGNNDRKLCVGSFKKIKKPNQ